jgi:hypothetical protein
MKAKIVSFKEEKHGIRTFLSGSHFAGPGGLALGRG